MPMASVKTRKTSGPPISNEKIGALFENIAALLEIENANPYRIRAYRNAARTVRAFAPEIATVIRKGDRLPKLPGIGQDLSAKIEEIVNTGGCALLNRLRGDVPPSLIGLLSIPGLGPRKVKHLYQDLGVETVEQLYTAARRDRVRRIHGFGKRTQEKLLHALEARAAFGRRVPLANATTTAQSIAEYLRKLPGVKKVTVAGSIRRMRDTVGDLDFLVAAKQPDRLMTWFIGYPDVAEVLDRGHTRTSVVLRTGFQVDLRVVEESAYGSALVYFTGSKAHGIAIRQRARRRGLKISEYGVFRGLTRIAGESEEDVYGALGLSLIPPEMRENRGEVEAAANGHLPRLIELSDLKGDLHAHTNATDGSNSLGEMAQAARAVGLEYLAITDHSRNLRVAHGLGINDLLRQIDRIDALNTHLEGITLLKGIEVDILENGELDFPDEVLAQLDVTVIAVHSHFDLPKDRQTRRLLRALERPYPVILAHPLGRLIGEREAIAVDMDAVMTTAKRVGCYLELNAQPKRMDIFDILCRQAMEKGVLICINSDAHRAADFGYLHYGIGQARRGWLEKKDVVNTRDLTGLKQLMRR